MFFVIIILAMTLACVAGVQFFYMMFLESSNRQHKRRIAELERQNAELEQELLHKEALLEQQTQLSEESWPEFLDDDAVR